MLIIVLELPKTKLHCDFCGSEPVVASHQAVPCEGNQDGEWAACAFCNDAIQEQNWDSLLNRGVRQIKNRLELDPILVPFMREDLRQIHNHFILTRGQVA